MNHLMVDIETMGNKPSAPIVAIGAVFFDPKSGELGAEFYVAVNLASSMDQGATPDGDTILWWLKQSAEARAAICTCKYPGKPDHSHLEIFRHTDYVPGGDRHAQSTIHRTPDHRRSEVRRSRTHR